MKRLAGKTALITGASSGIGRAIATRFHAEGATLLLMDITEAAVEGGEPTHKILGVPFFQGDVSNEKDVEEAVRLAALPTGRLDIVVNDAVIRSGKKLTDTSLEEWNRVMEVNVTGVFLMCRAAVRRMLTQDIRNEARGRIVNIHPSLLPKYKGLDTHARAIAAVVGHLLPFVEQALSPRAGAA